MHRFVIRENIRHFRRLLEATTEAGERARIHALLAEEFRKAETHGTLDGCDSERAMLLGGSVLSLTNGASDDRHR